MNNLTVTKEGLAKRCEICHQIDQYDALMDYCVRCKHLKYTNKNIENQEVNTNSLTVGNTIKVTQRWQYCKLHPTAMITIILFMFMWLPRLWFPILWELKEVIHPLFNMGLYLIIFGYCSLMSVSNKTIIKISRDSIIIQQRPFPMRRDIKYNSLEINNTTCSKSWMPGCYCLKVLLSNSKNKIILNYLTKQKAILIKRHIDEKLGLKD